MNFFRYIFTFIFVVLCIMLASCSSSVRFSSDYPKADKGQPAKVSKTEKTKTQSDIKLGKIDKSIRSEASNVTGKRKIIIEEGQKWIGTPYAWGGTDRNGADCSGFVMEIFKKANIELPRTAAEQYTVGQTIDLSEAQSGDLVFFRKGDKITHVGIYIGDNRILHSSSGKGVVIQNLSSLGRNPIYAGCKSIIY